MSNVNGGGLKSLPSLFDIGLYLFMFLAPIFFLPNWDMNMMQGMFFVFGILALLSLSFFCKREREYSNKYLGILSLWAMLNVFIHSFSASNCAYNFFNFCLLSEGFIYVLCGCLLFYLIVSYSRNFKLVYPILAINVVNLIFVFMQKAGLKVIWARMDGIAGILGMAPHMVIFSAISFPIIWHYKRSLALIPLANLLIGHYGWNHSFSGMFALVSAILIYCVVKKKIVHFTIILMSTSIFIGWHWHIFIGKAMLRFALWKYSFLELIDAWYKPLIGNGFDHSVSGMINVGYGFMYRHNDPLNITRDLGFLFLSVMLFGIFKILRGSKFDYLTVAILTAAFSCFTWTSIYFPRIAVFVLFLLSIKEKCRITIS